jgi:hypothetical protein
MLSTEPEINEPLGSCDPVLFIIIPSEIVLSTKASTDPLAKIGVPEPVAVVALVNEPVVTLVTNKVCPPLLK